MAGQENSSSVYGMVRRQLECLYIKYLAPNEGCAKFVADIECTASI